MPEGRDVKQEKKQKMPAKQVISLFYIKPHS